MAAPDIRFEGFSDAWEQRKFGEVATLRRGLTYSPSDICDSRFGVRVLRSSNILEDQFVLNEDDVFVNADAVNIDLVKSGDILITSANGSTRLVGKRAKIDDLLGKTVHGGFMLVASSDEPDFLVASMGARWYRKFLDRGVAGGNGAIGNLNAKVLNDAMLCVPNDNEQKAIGIFFNRLDSLISLHQKKYDKLVDTKKAMLGKMFPKEGETEPEIRFAGFKGDWADKKLGDLYVERTEKGNENLQILSVSIHHGISSGEMDDEELGKHVRRSEDKSKYKHVYYGDLVFNMMRAWQGALGVAKAEGMVSPAYITAIPSADVYPEFMDYCLRRDDVIAQIDDLSYGVTDFRKRLYWSSFVQVDICIPSVAEQKQITELFKRLDRSIELYQKKIYKLKDIKKSMLSRMICEDKETDHE